jgi:multicomponent Na+:H+ antiporter subunit D
MNNFIVLPLVIPLFSGLLMAVFRKNIRVQRLLSVFSILLTLAVSYYLLQTVKVNGIQILEMGGWPAPYGIVLVVDLFSALLLMTIGLVSFPCLIYAFQSIDGEREKFYFYTLIQFFLAGINGSFITGDIFNLYVCFEVMLLASYVLLSLGGSPVQLRESIKYIVINVLSSTFFLLGIAYLYGVLGTLNLAHLSARVAEAGQTGLMITIAVLFLIVFGIKAALFLFFWLPGAYSAPPAAVSAIFAALLTKVGIYAIFRMYTLIFYHQPQITHTLIAVMAALTMLLGGIGAVGQWNIRKILGYNVIIGVGFVFSGLAIYTSSALAGSIYYVIHDMVTKALLFLLGGTVISIVGTAKLKEISGLIHNHPSLGWMFLITTLALTGVPPLSGFIGKVLIIKEGLRKAVLQPGFYWLAGINLLSSLMILYSLSKIFINGFWGETQLSKEMEKRTTKGLLFPCVLLTAVCIFLGLGAEYLYPYVELASQTIMEPKMYIQAVLGEVF